jgi:hypothetical protein
MKSRFCVATLALSAATLWTPFLRAEPSLGLPIEIVVNGAPPAGAFPLVAKKHAAPLWYDAADFPGVVRAVGDLRADIERVTSRKPDAYAERPNAAELVIIGTLGKSAVIDALVASGKLDASDLRGKWESFVITTVATPMPGVERALVIAGSDKRGTIYGIYELSEQLGVSPWYWWADVPPKHHAEAYLLPGRFASGEPVVRYRGIFLNDERPCLTGWTKEKFGGLNSKFYTKVYELLLRMRGNYLWPAMWDNAFNEDDPLNPKLADEYGIVMGTSHHEPLDRSQKEWERHKHEYGDAEWNYVSNEEGLQRFWIDGIVRNKDYENILTLGMRGDGDMAMPDAGGMVANKRLLEQIIADQRTIISQHLNSDPAKVPQLLTLFSEVQRYFDVGLRVPDDVTVLFADDNVGNLRRLPTAEERRRSGGFGIYYHIDMHGGPFSYQWINTSPFPKIAEQMNLAYEYGATRLWIVNVGDLKPLELPMEFFLRMGWNPAALNKDKVGDYTRRWATREFGPEHAAEIAKIVSKCTKYNGWRKPEVVKPETYSLLDYDEADRVEAAWREVAEQAEKLYTLLPTEQRDAFYQLVLHPAKASAIVTEMNIEAGRNLLYAKQGRASTNAVAERVRELFRQDRALANYYNHTLAGGKWDHLMDQTHIGEYTWEPPVVDVMPAVSEVLPEDASIVGVSVEGDASSWPEHYGDAVLPVFDSFQPRRSYVDVFAVGSRPIECSIAAEQPWIMLIKDKTPYQDQRYWVEIDWSKAPVGTSTGFIKVSTQRGPLMVHVPVRKASEKQVAAARGCFASLGGPIAIAATAAATKTEVGGVRWEEIPDYGRVPDALAVYPVTAASILPPSPAPTLEYPVYLPSDGSYEVGLVLGPVQSFVPDRGMRIAVAFDDQAPQVLNIFADRAAGLFRDSGAGVLAARDVAKDNIHYLRSMHKITVLGAHMLKVAMVDPAVVVQKVIITYVRMPGGFPIPPPHAESYFGPPDCTPVR